MATTPDTTPTTDSDRVGRVLTMTATSWDRHAAEFEDEDPSGAQAWRSAAEELRALAERLSGATCRHPEARLPAPPYLEQESGHG